MKSKLRHLFAVCKCASAMILFQFANAMAQSPIDVPFYADKSKLLCWIDSTGLQHEIDHAADWQRRRAHILASMEEVMGKLPSQDPSIELDVQYYHSEELPTLTRKRIVYQSGKGDKIPAYLLIPKNVSGKAPAMLCLHGTSGSRGRIAGVGAEYPPYALELAERGYVTIAPDYTLLGDNQVDPESLGYASGTMKGIWSHMRAVDLLVSLPEVNKEQIGCIGLSLGGHNSLFVGAFDQRIKVIVSSSGFDSFADYMNGNLTGWCQKRYMPRIETVYGKQPAKLPFDFPEVLASVAPRHLYIHAPQGDSNFKVESVKRCVAAAHTVFRLLNADENFVVEYPPGEHGFPREARLNAYQFIDRVFGRENSKLDHGKREAR